MVAMDILQSLFRWIHVVAGILWIGLLYFFNFVNGPTAAVLDGETKKKVVPELMPRALFWFRWGAAYTWFSGLFLLLLVFYHGGLLFESGLGIWNTTAILMVALTFLGTYVYDLLMKTPLTKNPKVTAGIFFVLIGGVICLMLDGAGFSYRATNIHLGVMFGTTMAFNVWFRIWPAQQKIITAVKAGQAPDPAVVALAGLRSKHNVYLSIPLVWMMLNAHTTWAATSRLYLMGVIAIAWIGTTHLYKRAGKVKGF